MTELPEIIGPAFTYAAIMAIAMALLLLSGIIYILRAWHK